jgi:hypothetical protein
MSTNAETISHHSGQRNPDPVGSQLRYDSRGANDRTLKLYDGFWDQLLNEHDTRHRLVPSDELADSSSAP